MHNLFPTICLAGAIQALLLFLVLLIRKNNQVANRYFSFYLLFVCFDFLELYLGAGGLAGSAQPYRLSVIPYSFIFGPSMFLYIALLTGYIDRFPGKYLLLYTPFIPALMVNIILQASIDPASHSRTMIFVNIVINGGGLLYEAVLYTLSFPVLHKYMNRLKDYFSEIDALKLSFIRMGLVVLIISTLFIFMQLARGHVRHEHGVLDGIAILCGLGLIFIIAFFAILQPQVLNRIRLMDGSVADEGTATDPKYEKFRLPAEKEEEYVEKIQRHMAEGKPYLDEELTLQDLADELGLSTHHLSMILNIHFKQNFYNFINGYRVEEVKRKLTDPDYRDWNILSIAYNCGFNSKSTFNTMFRKFTGKTPREFRSE